MLFIPTVLGGISLAGSIFGRTLLTWNKLADPQVKNLPGDLFALTFHRSSLCKVGPIFYRGPVAQPGKFSPDRFYRRLLMPFLTLSVYLKKFLICGAELKKNSGPGASMGWDMFKIGDVGSTLMRDKRYVRKLLSHSNLGTQVYYFY